MSPRGKRVFIIGVGCAQLIKPRGLRSTNEMGIEAATKALLDAGITYDSIEHAFAGQVPPFHSLAALYNLGLTNNDCSTGSTVLVHAADLVRGGYAACTLALGFERMAPGSLATVWKDRDHPMLALDLANAGAEERLGENHGPGAPRKFCKADRSLFRGTERTRSTLGRVSEEQVLGSRKNTNNPTMFICSSYSDCAACCINQAIEIVSQALTTDGPETFNGQNTMDVVGCGSAEFNAPDEGRDEVGVAELHDCFAADEDAYKLVERYGGKQAKGHPLGASGLGMHFYITTPGVTDRRGRTVLLLVRGEAADERGK
ncbi:hypothetical protein FA95DRAFT_1585185 [Auriscalpium vulgare]|uniref:Uncharacterized protein n=1 Tax=Auriscalpium vulgare TaxID=40419 RepID=A0ACB8R6T4_9AGAM|nr:hypothetical protein FA95DRAFT_1585185 [Auriscalpium vulgare]